MAANTDTDTDDDTPENPCWLCDEAEATVGLRSRRRRLELCAACALHALPEVIASAVVQAGGRRRRCEAAGAFLERLHSCLDWAIDPDDGDDDEADAPRGRRW
jgi:hypothetical protein